jgi:hypothetical protein
MPSPRQWGGETSEPLSGPVDSPLTWKSRGVCLSCRLFLTFCCFGIVRIGCEERLRKKGRFRVGETWPGASYIL